MQAHRINITSSAPPNHLMAEQRRQQNDRLSETRCILARTGSPKSYLACTSVCHLNGQLIHPEIDKSKFSLPNKLLDKQFIAFPFAQLFDSHKT